MHVYSTTLVDFANDSRGGGGGIGEERRQQRRQQTLPSSICSIPWRRHSRTVDTGYYDSAAAFSFVPH